MITEWQSHSGAVNTSTSPSVQYSYSEMPSGANHSRLTSVKRTKAQDGYELGTVFLLATPLHALSTWLPT